MMKCAKFILFLFLSLWITELSAQTTKVRGRVTDAKTGEPLPLVSISFVGTTIGITTDFDGYYTIETRAEVSEIMAAYLSYERQVVKIKPGAFNTVDFKLEPVVTDLGEVTVTPGENPAHAILRNISKNKKRNNPAEKDSYHCSTYTKMELDVANIKPEFKNKKLQKNFGFIFQYIDTSVITGKAYLPVMISEASADYYYRKTPRLSREVVKASRISGIEEDYTLAQFTGHLHVNVNLYDNYINIFEVNFASPLSEHGLMYYKYFLVDSVQKEGRKIYKIRFHPKGKSTPVFDGEINVDSLTWALESATLRMVKGLNVNWIRDLVIENTNELVNDSTWFLKQDKIMADFTVQMKDSSKLISFMGHRQIDYSNVRINEDIPPEIARLDNDMILSEDVLKNDENYWETVRPYQLSERERNIYNMVDSIKNVPLYQNIYDLINTVLFGYYPVKRVELGPYYKLFSFNKLEGARFQLGARTTSEFSKKIRLSGYGAYSTKDNEFKGGGNVEIIFNTLPTSKLTIGGRHDVFQLGASENAFTTGNILSSIFSRGNNEKLTLINQFDLRYEKEWWSWFTNTFAYEYRQMFPTPYVDFLRPDSTEVSQIRTSQFRLGLRFSKNEIVVRKTFDKLSMGSDYPIVGLDLIAGVKGVFNSQYNYQRLELSVKHDFTIAPIGYSDVMLSGGKIFGKVPYPLLKLHEGNATYFYDPYAFSCMNFYEFASDLWGAVFWEHHFRGFFLSKIPLMKRLKWREVATVKALWGSLSDRNNGSRPDTEALLLFPKGMSSVSKPYIEAGFGIENIFRFIRIDAMWRITHRKDKDRQDVDNFAINFSLHLNF
ncbi:DUF5686 and carboxypeptidase-like regulatory domain-containing protein [uncultured Sanguibacteroides sp.]|uniref:DUF5686 and carboxypeptidase-like regulatory domain-containing protein n=1 Tax=uncultured Sanguibacteroides sp. TaxID=1635151 RepID=UPI0025D2F66D|nr:DUF5686 and carboxypeptidase-like regulatory domain-containing protein [uncultured Sanguibacteroides sp.]